ncbi:DUF1249 domain-containing protein [Modicisalibacter tunisiensis]|uniref:DUF1249 domain-containing protein n=1 Tax=Modicisalibacter tunisiensis TaxID=390637 RepID=A0ABS7WZ49_9GAMM|nr:DUF1249 domain-containing protein [Modicisalibacter tunisiensis]KXS38659.1 MAG: hypothetical protein AWU55_1250 [Halomonadaceae bacterium T82-2]MBZ9538685.1 DUF1249 domain-containing protein [Modicisalibacter tunisiensis]MBZ9567901.1 DUF1249 domain-containing protein [Modicisalibacter tunisiensis]
MARTAYVTDLKSLQAECSANYLRLTRLVDDLEAGAVREVPLAGHAGRFGTLWLEVAECAPYTTILRVAQTGVLDGIIDSPRMTVHLYHDVRMAEVTDFQRQRHFHGRYRYPNPRMHQPDEKLQLNRFLGEWLEHGLAHGHAADLTPLR